MAQLLSEETGTQIESDFIWLALEDLRKANLLETEDHFELSTVSRRKILFRYALPTIALPVIVSLVAPPAVNAQSCAPTLGQVGDMCISPADCCPGLFCALPGVPAPGMCSAGV